VARRGGWGDTAVSLPPGRWVNVTTGAAAEGSAPLADLLDPGHVALLVRAG